MIRKLKKLKVGYFDFTDENIKGNKTEEPYSISNRYRIISVDEWKYRDFSNFIVDYTRYVLIKEKEPVNNIAFVFSSNIAMNICYVDMIDHLNTYSGNNYCPLLLKAYLEWFIKEYAVKIIKRIKPDENGTKRFSLHLFNNPHYMNIFLENCGIHQNMRSVHEVERKLASYDKIINKKVENKVPAQRITKKTMDELFKLGIASMLTEFGIILTGNYLVLYKGKNKEDAFKEIASFLKTLNCNVERYKKTLKLIVHKTCIMSPYNKHMLFLDWKSIFKDFLNPIEKELDFSLFVSSDDDNLDNYRFLTEKAMRYDTESNKS